MVSMPGMSEGRSTPASSLSGLPSGTTRPGWGAVRAASAAEQKVLAMASWKPAVEKRAAHDGFGFGPGQRANAFTEGGQRVGETVVAVDARDLFDEIDFALEVEAPTGQRDVPCSVGGLRGRCTDQRAAEGDENVFDGRGVDAVFVFGGAKQAMNFAEGERDGLALHSASIP